MRANSHRVLHSCPPVFVPAFRQGNKPFDIEFIAKNFTKPLVHRYLATDSVLFAINVAEIVSNCLPLVASHRDHKSEKENRRNTIKVGK